MTTRILIVDDEQGVRDLLTELLEQHGFDVTAVADSDAMFSALSALPHALVVIDLRLGKEDGMNVARQLRHKSVIPIMMLTGKGDETDRILGLELAADDFLMKPFNNREFLARVRALIRRTTELSVPARRDDLSSHERISFNDWTLDLTSRELFNAAGQPLELTYAEFNLLEALVRAPNRILSRDQLLELTRGNETEVFDRTIDVLILRLRRKIEPNPRQPSLIRTERGLGYIFSAHICQC
ncbi:transcriptional regulator [Pokkaliibacter plantistimulans]|uniref:Transcriptional regulator n=1 Tax=Pokkaliibacter plantistimulans TaxID=1635171 RepID=A0ABX5LTZ0_9GAMM|nr:response regulator [Pokkaliibacter plantistimulans]PXF30127.1 transcriptional regulator [Pokkaliibacter plantistimulans]